MNSFSQSIKKILYKLQRGYWSLSYWPRHIVGVCLLLSVIIGFCVGVYGVYRGMSFVVASASEFISQLFIKGEPLDGSDPYARLDEYSRPGFSHYKFSLSENDRHPKRRPNFHKDFNHLNDVHLEAARKLGIKPVNSREELEMYQDKLVELHETRYYKVDKLTQSVPFLVPKAADFLTEVGRLMQQYNGTHSRFIITSVLRTTSDVKRLRRGNSNASENSAHRFATTIDITYNRFDVQGKTWEGKLKEDLARALYDLQQKGYCYVKYEVKQACFHITVRP